MKPKFLAAKLALVIAVSSTLAVTPVQAGIPVIDGTNLSQNIMTAIESVAQTLKQIEQYSTQLQQYQNQLQNTMAPAAYIWDQAQSTINGLMNAVNTLDYYKTQLGSLDSYIGKFQDVNYYKNSPCFTAAGCSTRNAQHFECGNSSRASRRRRPTMPCSRGLDRQQTNLTADAATLQRLQSAAQGAQGQMQAIGYANQLASQQANQLCRFVAC